MATDYNGYVTAERIDGDGPAREGAVVGALDALGRDVAVVVGRHSGHPRAQIGRAHV